ncbi:uncharacterized protein LOC134770283 [Penaeus indicus]|uniref:uncharacterized protein LOC134770283 n=1 Tax=Penaeus indicus TaxID=29960 RepID=UPI00300C9A25
MKALVLFVVGVVAAEAALAPATPARDKRTPDDDDILLYLASRRSPVGARTRPTFQPRQSFGGQRTPFYYFDDDFFDFDRKKRSAPQRQKRDLDFDFDDDDDDYVFYRAVQPQAATYTATQTSTTAAAAQPVPTPVYYYVDIDDDIYDRKKRSADFDFEDYLKLSRYSFGRPATSSLRRTSYAPVAPAPIRVRYYDDDLFDFDRKKRSADFDLYDDDDDAKFAVMYSQPSYTQVTRAATATQPLRTFYYYYDDDK